MNMNTPYSSISQHQEPILPSCRPFFYGLVLSVLFLLSSLPAVSDQSPAVANPGGAVSYVENAAPMPVAPSLTVTDPDGPNLTGAKVTITSGFASGQDVLGFTSGAGITGSYNASSGVLSLSGSATAATYQAVLRSVTYRNTSENPSGAQRTVTFSIGESTLYYSVNGHYYEFVSSSGITWSNARTTAAARQLFGLQGYLATITSAGENAFVAGKLQGVGWIGGTDEAVEGVWRWATGPEAGTQFWQGLSYGSTVGGQFANWNGGEPNNAGNEDYAHMIFNSSIGPVGSWNDLPLAGGGGDYAVAGYLVEYGGTPGDSTPQLTATATVNVTPANDPPTITNISNQSINVGGSTGPLVFTVGDFETAAGSLTVSATSSDSDAIPVGNITFGGSGANRTVTATAASGGCGFTTITVTVSDGLASASDSFDVTLIDNQPPTVSCPQLAPVSVDANCSAVIPNVLFGVIASDNCTASSQLILTQSPAAGTAVSLGTHTITVTVTDLAGNSTQCQTTFSVVPGLFFSQPVPEVFPGTQFLTCIIGNFQEPTRIQNWKLRLRSASTETVTLTVAATTVNTSETGSIEATVTDQTGLKTVTVVHPATQTDNLGTLSLTLQGGATYDLAIKRTGQAAHYKLGSPDKRLEIGFAYPLLYLEDHQQAWTFNAAANESVSIDVLKDLPAVGGADPQATIMTYSIRRPDCTVVVPSTTMAVTGAISFSAGSGGAFVLFIENTDGHFALRKNSGCDGGFYALPCPPKVQIACPTNIIKSNDPGQCGAVASFAATATGVCSPTVTYSKAPGSFFPIGTTVVTATATDIFGETATCAFTVTVNDTEKPAVTCPANLTVNTAPGRCDAVVTFAVTATDNCPGVTVASSPPSGSTFQKGATTVTSTATDASGNVSTCSFTVTVNDTELPALAVPAPIVVSNDPGKCDAVVSFTVTGSDNCPGVTVVSTPGPGSVFTKGTSIVTSIATDGAGNVTTKTFTVTVNDTEAPKIATPASSQTVECDGAGNSAVLNAWLASNGGAVATDNCGSVSWSHNFTALSDGCGATGSATVTFTATDPSGNSLSTTATFTIVDTTAPKVGVAAANQTVECDGAGNTTALNAWLASNGGAVASDVCGNVTWSHNFSALSDLCGATGTAAVNFTATDECGNTSTTTATFTIVDTIAPKIDVVAANKTVECDGAGNTAALSAWLASNGGAVASDICGNVTWSNNFTALSDLCGATGSSTVTFTATDACGKTSTTTATFTIVDTTPPSIPTPASNLTVECDGSGNIAQLNSWLISHGGAIASDICAGVTWSHDFTTLSDNGGNTGSATVTFTATDGCGNASTTTAIFSIVDTTAPVVTAAVTETSLWPPNHNLNLVNVGFSLSVSDVCDLASAAAVTVAVYSDEDDEEQTAEGKHSPDAKDIASGTLRLRAERKGNSDGRVYLIIVTSTDGSGNVGKACVTVVVPQSKSSASIDSVNAQAAAAKAYCNANGTAPVGYFVVGDGAIIGPKQ
jgi:hypothetical protein